MILQTQSTLNASPLLIFATFACMNLQTHTLPNGIRLAHLQEGNMAAHFGFMVHTGSRDEKVRENGMAHFIEHVIFKGTRKRKAFHILSRLEDVGGELNAYTTKEETCIYASFLKQDYERAIELVYDICFNSVFPPRELDREKSVIVDEIMSYLDTPSELIFDEFEEQVFNHHPIGRSILGDEKRIMRFSRDDVNHFIRHNYATSEMVLCSVGDLSFSQYKKLCEKYFGQVVMKDRLRKRTRPDTYEPVHRSVDKHTHQSHCIIGNVAYDAHSEKRYPLALLNNLLGGPGMTSRLNMSLREKTGYSYNVESQYAPYTDTGILDIYFGSDKDKFEKSLILVYREFQRLREEKLGTLQLSKAKKQLMGQVAIASESNEHLMLTLGKSILLYDRYDSLGEINEKIDSITASHILEVANEILDPKILSLLHYK